jgi:hypothetical protein
MKLFELFGAAPKEKKHAEKEKFPAYHFESIRELQEPIRSVVEQLQEEIDAGVYDTLISDDASARLPTLAFREIIGQRIEAKNPDLTPEEKRDALKTFFIAGGRRMENEKALGEFFQEIKPGVKKRALLVTEYMSTGESLKRVMALLDKAGILYDVAAVMAEHSEQDYKSLFSNFINMHRLVIGATGREEPAIYNAAELSGVYKYSEDLKAHPRRYKGEEYEEVSEGKRKAREDVHTMAQEVLKEAWEK